MKPNLDEARRLLDAGFHLVPLHSMEKRPIGNDWNTKPPVKKIDPEATGYGMPLAQNNLCSVDPDHYDMCKVGMAAWGFDLDEVLAAGVRTESTRTNSGGRAAFCLQDDLKWLKLVAYNQDKVGVTVLELRAKAPNLQDVVPGIVYTDKTSGEICTQKYANGKTFEDRPKLPKKFAKHWRRMSTEHEYHDEQCKLFVQAIAEAGFEIDGEPVTHIPPLFPSGKHLAYPSNCRLSFNKEHNVPDILTQHGYEEVDRGRWTHPGATGAPGIRLIPGKDDLWQSDHGGDPLNGTFDAWVANVQLNFKGDLAAAVVAHEFPADGFVAEDEEADVDEPKVAPAPVVEDWPEDLLTAPGMVGELMDYINRSALIPQPLLAIPAALTAVALLSGNRYSVAHWRTRLNLYTLSVLVTGGGKDWPANVMMEAGSIGERALIVNDVASGAAMVKALDVTPNMLLWRDEVWQMLETVNSSKGNPHQKELAAILMGLYGAAGRTYHGKIYANPKDNVPPVQHPFVCFAGATTPQRFTETLEQTQVADGFLNRFVAFLVDTVPEDDAIPELERMPPVLVAKLKHLAELDIIADLDADPFDVSSDLPRVITMTEDAKAHFEKYGKHCRTLSTKVTPLAPLHSRARENALKVAGIVAVGVDPEKPEIDLEGAQWAVRLVTRCLMKLTGQLEREMSEGKFDKDCKRALEMVRNCRSYKGDKQFGKWCAKGMIPRGKLLKLMKMSSRELDTVTEFLVESKQIRAAEKKTGGKKAMLFAVTV